MNNIRKLSVVSSNADDYSGKSITVAGWIKTLRESKNFSFMVINDGSLFDGVQIVLEPQFIENYETVVKLGIGSAVIVTGELVLTPNAKQPFEIKASDIHCVPF